MIFTFKSVFHKDDFETSPYFKEISQESCLVQKLKKKNVIFSNFGPHLVHWALIRWNER